MTLLLLGSSSLNHKSSVPARKTPELGMKSGVLGRGVGVTSRWCRCGNRRIANLSTIKVGLCSGGTVIRHQGSIGIGQVSSTMIAQISAKALGISFDVMTLEGIDKEIPSVHGKSPRLKADIRVSECGAIWWVRHFVLSFWS